MILRSEKYLGLDSLALKRLRSLSAVTKITLIHTKVIYPWSMTHNPPIRLRFNYNFVADFGYESNLSVVLVIYLAD